MSTDDIRRLYDKLDSIARQQAVLDTKVSGLITTFEAIQIDLRDVREHGCLKKPEHDRAVSVITAHEQRIAMIEADKNKILGASSVIAGACGLLGMVIGKFWK